MNRKIYIYSIFLVALDQTFKIVVETILELNSSIEVIKNLFYITYTTNYGAAWGIMQNKVWFFIFIALIALMFFYNLSYNFKLNKRNTIAFSLVIGGLIGNLIDRVFLGYVRDFIHVYLGTYSFPVFNIADIGVVCGTILLIIAIVKGEDKKDDIKDRN